MRNSLLLQHRSSLGATYRRSSHLHHRRSVASPFAEHFRQKQEREIRPNVFEGEWDWQGMEIRYQRSGKVGPSVILVHGFGGNCDHWRKNTPVLGENCRVYSLDLLGFGYSAKPDPRLRPPGMTYNFETWAEQVADFAKEVVESPCFLICNSIGGIVGLQAAIDFPDMVKAVQLLNVSLRLLHVSHQSPIAKPFIRSFQNLLYSTPAGLFFFDQVAKYATVEKILKQAYHNSETVTDELVEAILKPGLEPGAALVFLAFISYSGGPLPGELLDKISQPVSILWGTEDPWEPIEKGRSFADLPVVEEFVELKGVGHCPQDEASEIVNPLIERFVRRHSSLP